MNVNDNTAVKPSHKARRGLALLIIGGVLFLVFLALNNAARDSYDSTLSEASVAVALAMYGFIGVGLVLVVWGLLRD